MITRYYDIAKSHVLVNAEDARYGVRFAHEVLVGKTWEFDPMSDAVGQFVSKNTGKIMVEFIPSKKSMTFPEDAGRRTQYIMPIDDARHFWQFIKARKPSYWFALDMAFETELRGSDVLV